MTLLAHTLPHLVQMIPLTTKLQLSPYQDHQIPTHIKREREVDIISGTLHYPQNMPTSLLIYQRDELETQNKYGSGVAFEVTFPTPRAFSRKLRKEKKGLLGRESSHFVLTASYLNKCIKNPTSSSLSIYFS